MTTGKSPISNLLSSSSPAIWFVYSFGSWFCKLQFPIFPMLLWEQEFRNFPISQFPKKQLPLTPTVSTTANNENRKTNLNFPTTQTQLKVNLLLKNIKVVSSESPPSSVPSSVSSEKILSGFSNPGFSTKCKGCTADGPLMNWTQKFRTHPPWDSKGKEKQQFISYH